MQHLESLMEEVDKASLVCVGGEILEGNITENGVNIISKKKFPEAYENKCLNSGSNPHDLSDRMANLIDVKLTYS